MRGPDRTPITPGPGQESVWEYPRPPALRSSGAHVVVEAPGGRVIAESRRTLQVLETSHPPGVYLPPEDVDLDALVRQSAPRTVCEWKGAATYWDLVLDDLHLHEVGWSYEQPTPAFAPIAGYVTVYPRLVGRCLVDGEVVRPQEGEFYGGWITDAVVGPFKGPPGTMFW